MGYKTEQANAAYESMCRIGGKIDALAARYAGAGRGIGSMAPDDREEYEALRVSFVQAGADAMAEAYGAYEQARAKFAVLPRLARESKGMLDLLSHNEFQARLHDACEMTIRGNLVDGFPECLAGEAAQTVDDAFAFLGQEPDAELMRMLTEYERYR